ncbi:hypothetical protein EYF80_036840 [Liparis tanakae]|uniref:Uncharacterized protein n=1 Tax=Liparis tanakae TaxID=230148 RepID=A0A4Z2GID5_9TELE|nr:hypothetical protein EYF80_036840 [Liparis tanakae]
MLHVDSECVEQSGEAVAQLHGLPELRLSALQHQTQRRLLPSTRQRNHNEGERRIHFEGYTFMQLTKAQVEVGISALWNSNNREQDFGGLKGLSLEGTPHRRGSLRKNRAEKRARSDEPLSTTDTCVRTTTKLGSLSSTETPTYNTEPTGMAPVVASTSNHTTSRLNLTQEQLRTAMFPE